MRRALQGIASFWPSQSPEANSPHRSDDGLLRALPQPASEGGDADAQLRVQPHFMVFPKPLMQMPYERASADEAALAGCVHEHFGDATLVSLPIYVRVEVYPPDGNTECMLIATRNRRGHGHGGDGLTAYASVNRTCFSFRTGVFAGFPSRIRQHATAMLRQRQWNEISMALSEQHATYWINGVQIASLLFEDGDLPGAQLYVGLVSYSTEYSVRRFDVSRDPRLLKFVCSSEEIRAAKLWKERVITLHTTILEDGGTSQSVVSILCTNIAGEQVAVFELAKAESLESFRQELTEQLRLGVFDDMRLVLSDGSLLGEADDHKPLSLALGLDQP
eukprot:TRINITY_DN30014_c0_g1_i1.p1 TRINITY_DN30014_c0_g1~~TRINITY_DN30014_c0_g1_i1.p1  ORF type:complete len:333 (-),score=41.81 TRINITY_DN30014_c0_g1_i1:156-1154(-)